MKSVVLFAVMLRLNAFGQDFSREYNNLFFKEN